MKAAEAVKLTVRQLDGIYSSVMEQIRQEARDGRSQTVYYLRPEYDRAYYSPLIDRLKEDGYSVKFEHIPDPRDEDYSQLTISWKSHVMDKDLAAIQTQAEEEVETIDEIVDDLYKMAEKHDRLSGRGGRDSDLGRKYKLQSTIERNIARRIEKAWKHAREDVLKK